MTIMQGDGYPITFRIKTFGRLIDINTVEMVELVIGSVVKKYPNTVYYDEETSRFKAYFTQEETFAFSNPQQAQIRVKLTNGDVFGKKFPPIEILQSSSKEVL